MKKILILSMAGRTNEEEDVKQLHLYLLSIKEKLVPFYNVSVVLYNASTSSEKTINLLKEYNLENVVNVRRLDDMDLPTASYEFLNSTFFATRIGLVMNMMFDYAKQNNFFDADWIFHTDTDTEFLDSFKTVIDKCCEMQELKEQIFISQMGDINDANIEIDNKRIYFKPPRRLNVYDSNETFDNFYNNYKIETIDTQQEIEKPLFAADALKIKNDFIGFSRKAAESVVCNWVGVASYIRLRDAKRFTIENYDGSEFATNNDITIVINKDKGGLVLRDMQFGKYDVLHIQLPSDTIMKHLNGGWIHESNYHSRALESLETNYSQYESVWAQSYKKTQTTEVIETPESNNQLDIIKTKISQLEKSLQDVQELLKNFTK